MTTVLITGADGYIGRHLAPVLAARGLRVCSIRADVRRASEVRAAMEGIDVVVHLACLPVNRSFEFPDEDFEVNALGTFNVLDAARRAGVKKVVYTSTCEVYGPPDAQPVDETHPVRPASPYAASKHSGELSCLIMCRVFGLPTTILRLFNVYGLSAGLEERPTVEAAFMKNVLQGRAPVIKSHPGTARDFVHVRDVCRAIALAIDAEAASGEIINIGAGVATSLQDLADLVIRLTGVAVKPQIAPAASSSDPPLVCQADIRKAARLLGWHPEVTLSEGLEEIHRFYRDPGKR
ncbi:MAG: hypothetical protein A3G34_12805 [Candidatus Lindowbacteria bacterium RIFCSPLOWO2_12_FULL_62_27]|nr:MAG: hypothetical protein A3I06_15260 [Candidatus Lindowbacteria bacterium RIFCSPLOWO2_02_FULL_62_12]OGH62474.1 MAG: hypothetical protein A3G34_12805 [Candidatus Lindowbacteria bacterium RIFCSPLOWO2_12_FULL_62_27]